MLEKQHNLCAQAYLENYRTNFKKYAWSYDYVDTLIKTNPLKSLDLMIDLLKLCQNQTEIVYIGSGPLEDLLHTHLTVIQDDIQRYCHQNKRLRFALQYVWAKEESLVYKFLIHINRSTFVFNETSKHKYLFQSSP